MGCLVRGLFLAEGRVSALVGALAGQAAAMPHRQWSLHHSLRPSDCPSDCPAPSPGKPHRAIAPGAAGSAGQAAASRAARPISLSTLMRCKLRHRHPRPITAVRDHDPAKGSTWAFEPFWGHFFEVEQVLNINIVRMPPFALWVISKTKVLTQELLETACHSRMAFVPPLVPILPANCFKFHCCNSAARATPSEYA